MGEITRRERDLNDIRQDITMKQHDLVGSFERLGNQLERTMDWRTHVSRHPYLAAGIAAGIGFWLVRWATSRRDHVSRVEISRRPPREAEHEIVESGRRMSRREADEGIASAKALLVAAIVKAGLGFLSHKVMEAVTERRA